MDVSFDAAWTAVSQRPAVNRAMPALVSLVILLAIAGALIPSFLLPDRLLLLGQQVAPLALVAIGQTLVVLMGGIDLSVGSILTLSLVLGAGLSRGSDARSADRHPRLSRSRRGDRPTQWAPGDAPASAGADQHARNGDHD